VEYNRPWKAVAIVDQLDYKFSAFYYRVRKSLPLFPVLGEMNPVHCLISYFFKRLFNIIILSTPRSFKLSFTFRIFYENVLCISYLSSVCGMLRPIHHPFLKFEIFTAVKMLMVIFWVVRPFGLVDGKQCFEALYCLHLQGEDRGDTFLQNVSRYLQDHTEAPPSPPSFIWSP
jgi:hypothetical protein